MVRSRFYVTTFTCPHASDRATALLAAVSCPKEFLLVSWTPIHCYTRTLGAVGSSDTGVPAASARPCPRTYSSR